MEGILIFLEVVVFIWAAYISYETWKDHRGVGYSEHVTGPITLFFVGFFIWGQIFIGLVIGAVALF